MPVARAVKSLIGACSVKTAHAIEVVPVVEVAAAEIVPVVEVAAAIEIVPVVEVAAASAVEVAAIAVAASAVVVVRAAGGNELFGWNRSAAENGRDAARIHVAHDDGRIVAVAVFVGGFGEQNVVSVNGDEAVDTFGKRQRAAVLSTATSSILAVEVAAILRECGRRKSENERRQSELDFHSDGFT